MAKDGLIYLVIIILALGLVAVSVTQQEIEVEMGGSDETVTVSGQAEITTAADQAEVYLAIRSTGKTAQDAQDANTMLSTKVIDALKAQDADVESDSYYLNEEYDWTESGRKSLGYAAVHTLHVTVSDVEMLGDIIDTGIKAGATNVNRIAFTLSDEMRKSVNDQALEKASMLAKEKAMTLAKATGAKLGDVSSIQESNYYYQPYEYARGAAMDMAVSESAESSYMKFDTEPQDVQVRATVTVSYELE